ncbi:uncharacterized protein LTR77_003402 [Saxophila tyrrhenica]|uniref:Uncharacterized protein n=1 Tax=Saxophila tyrrhenica TaxID=1690608 RepID=A0AAV9PGZ5_9PEZI|nr:hypothetical protein LTR77_003402 [Saxophila tyrrhenica]
MAPSRALRPMQNICATCLKRQQPAIKRFYSAPANESALPRVATPSFWSSLVPKPLRRQQPSLEESATTPPRPGFLSRVCTRPRDWNPYTIFILLGLLAGSNAIQILALRNDMLKYTRQTEAKLGLLREVVQKVKNGEEVDVRKALGTGDEQTEREWEEMVKELEETDTVIEGWKRKAEKRKEREAARLREGGGPGDVKESRRTKERVEPEVERETSQRRPKFVV